MFDRAIKAICRSSYQRPWLWVLAAALICVPAQHQVMNELRLNTDLTTLLPEESPAVHWSRELRDVVGDGGVFSILFEGNDPQVLLRVLEETGREVEALPEIQSVEFRYPVEFVDRFSYLLVPSELLQKLFDVLVTWKAEASPFGLKLSDDEKASERQQEEVVSALELASNLPEVHQNRDGNLVGMLVYPRDAITSIGKTGELFERLEEISQKKGAEHGVWAGEAGTMRNKLEVLSLVLSDLGRSGVVAILAILGALILSFRSVKILPVLLWPPGCGSVVVFCPGTAGGGGPQ